MRFHFIVRSALVHALVVAIASLPIGAQMSMAEGIPPTPTAKRSTRVHPQPNLSHATLHYSPAFALGPGHKAVFVALDKPALDGGLDLDEAPLREFADRVATTYEIPVELDFRALEDLGLDPDFLLTCRHGGDQTLRSILSSVLPPFDLTFTVLNDSLVITTRDSENLLVAHYPFPTTIASGEDIQRTVDLIQSTVAPDTWDSEGGEAAIRPAPEENAFVIRAPLDSHLMITDLFRSGFDNDLEPAITPDTPRMTVIRTHAIAHAPDADFPAWIVARTNASLGALADEHARVTMVPGDRLVVESTSRPFHVFAAELIRSLNGITVPDPGMGTGGGGMNGGMFCWVAREVYGVHDPRWLVFRSWISSDAPAWLHDLYAAHGESFADWLSGRPAARLVLRLAMDQVIGDSDLQAWCECPDDS